MLTARSQSDTRLLSHFYKAKSKPSPPSATPAKLPRCFGAAFSVCNVMVDCVGEGPETTVVVARTAEEDDPTVAITAAVVCVSVAVAVGVSVAVSVAVVVSVTVVATVVLSVVASVVVMAAESMVLVCELAVSTGGAVVVSATGGGMTLRVTVAPHSARGVPLGQQPASVQ